MKLKVDNLKHLFDHGCAVEFTHPKLRELVAHVLATEGEHRFTAGQSRLTLIRRGELTFAEIFLSVGSYTRRAAHYFEPKTGLKYVLRDFDGENEAHAFRAVKTLVLGDSPSAFFRPQFGQDQDAVRRWFSEWGFSLTGAVGMRAKAIERATLALRTEVTSAGNQLDYVTIQEERARTENTAENFRTRHAHLREKVQRQLADADTRLAHHEEQRARLLKSDLPENEVRSISDWLGAQVSWESPHTLYFPDTAEEVSPPVRRANYSAKVNGEEITLSSGIRCEFTYSQLREWLAGRAPAPATRYGAVTREEVTNSAGAPAVLLRCGCHLIDAAAAAPELAPYLVATHAVTRIPARPRVKLSENRDAFVARALEILDKRIELQRETRAAALRDFAADRKRLEQLEQDAPTFHAEMKNRVAEASARLTAAKKALADFVAPLGADLAEVNRTAAGFVSLLLPAPFAVRS